MGTPRSTSSRILKFIQVGWFPIQALASLTLIQLVVIDTWWINSLVFKASCVATLAPLYHRWQEYWWCVGYFSRVPTGWSGIVDAHWCFGDKLFALSGNFGRLRICEIAAHDVLGNHLSNYTIKRGMHSIRVYMPDDWLSRILNVFRSAVR